MVKHSVTGLDTEQENSANYDIVRNTNPNQGWSLIIQLKILILSVLVVPVLRFWLSCLAGEGSLRGSPQCGAQQPEPGPALRVAVVVAAAWPPQPSCRLPAPSPQVSNY